MLIVPVFTRSDQKRIPYVCILLISINCLIFFLLQSRDASIQQEAYRYYEESGLLALELQEYKKYLSAKGDPAAEEMSADGNSHLVRMMLRDDDFIGLLEDNRIITPQNQIFNEWRQKRTAFETRLHQASIYKYGYSPKRQNITGLLTCTFFHGGFMHLLGNMVFLYLVGAILELAIGPLFFLVLYVITGICASALFGIVYPATPGPLVGASGAIAGLMGGYGVVFGLRKIRVFYSLGFYFNYAMVPALMLFPFWLANEFFQLFTNKGSNVAYVAHIGGLLSGVTIGIVYKALLKNRIDSLFVKAEIKQTVGDILDHGLKKLMDFDLVNARREFQKVLVLDPENIQAIRQLYVVDKSSPETEQFHFSAQRLLEKIKNGPADEYIEQFEDYRSTTSKPRLSLDMLERLSFLYLARKDYGKAAPLVSTLFKQNPKSINLPGYLLKLAEGFHRNNKFNEAQKCYQVLAKRYPASDEGMSAGAMLDRLNH